MCFTYGKKLYIIKGKEQLTNEEKLEHINKLRLIDDMFFEVFGNCREAVEELIRVILQDDSIVVS